MKSTMTERDKKLLVGMFIGVIIVAIGYWGILPQIKAYNTISDKIEKEENTKKINELKLLNVGTIQIQAEDYESRIAEKKDEFFQILSSSEIDRMMTEMATDNGLDIYDLSFKVPTTPSERMAYKNSQLYNIQLQQMAAYQDTEAATSAESDVNDPSLGGAGVSAAPTKNAEEINAEVFGEEEGGYRPNTDIYAVPVTMTVGGDLDDLENFIDDIINRDKRILMVGYSWGEYRNLIRGTTSEETTDAVTDSSEGVTAEEDATVENLKTKKSLTVKLEIYMCDTTDVNTDGEAVEGTETEETETGEE